MMIQDLLNQLNLDQMLIDVNQLLMMMIDLRKNANDRALKMMTKMDVQTNQQEYIAHHININLTICVDHESNTMDREPLKINY